MIVKHFVLSSCCILVCLNVAAQSVKFKIHHIAQELSWRNKPEFWLYSNDTLTIKAGPKTDLFIDPQQEYSVDNSPRALLLPAALFLLSCKLDVAFASDYDAGVLMLYAEKNHGLNPALNFHLRKNQMLCQS